MKYSVDDIEILVSTINQKSLAFLFKMFPNETWKRISILIVNQTRTDQLVSNYHNIKIINSREIGLSNSRNVALKNASKEILLIADDDIVYKENFIESILEGFNSVSADVICFQYEIYGKPAKNYLSRISNDVNWLRLLNTSSVEVALKKELVYNTFYFDDKFGKNAPFLMGEEIVFLSDLKNNKYKIGYFPQLILSHNHLTTGFKTPIEQIYYSSGAIFYRIFEKKYLLWILIKLFFDLKQKKVKITDTVRLFKKAIGGKKAFIKMLKRK